MQPFYIYVHNKHDFFGLDTLDKICFVVAGDDFFPIAQINEM